nr:hypothetical protein Iba_chr03cCG4350 [Ipomoea batatas]GMD82523.1 hypothetical protein Iba_scaffold348405CG0010 [Ipomoea batatas]
MSMSLRLRARPLSERTSRSTYQHESQYHLCGGERLLEAEASMSRTGEGLRDIWGQKDLLATLPEHLQWPTVGFHRLPQAHTQTGTLHTYR